MFRTWMCDGNGAVIPALKPRIARSQDSGGDPAKFQMFANAFGLDGSPPSPQGDFQVVAR